MLAMIGMPCVGKSMRTLSRMGRHFSSEQQVSSRARMSNLIIAGALLTFVGGIYTYTVVKIKGKDELQTVIDQEIGKGR